MSLFWRRLLRAARQSYRASHHDPTAPRCAHCASSPRSQRQVVLTAQRPEHRSRGDESYQWQSPESVPDTTSAALLIQMTVRDQVAEMLFERVSTDTRQPDRIANRDAPVFAGEFDDLQ